MEWVLLVIAIAIAWQMAVSVARRRDRDRAREREASAPKPADVERRVVDDRIEHWQGDRLVKVAYIGDDNYEREVVGLHFHREALAEWLTYALDIESGREETLARLVREPENEHDPNAVAVQLLGETVGHVPAKAAARLAPQLDTFGPGVEVTCPAKVRWDTETFEVFGVYLDIVRR